MKEQDLRVYLVTDRLAAKGRDAVCVIAAALKGGVTMIQVREKEASARDFIAFAKAVKELAAPYGVPVVINDRVDVAVAAGADGVHLGQSDIPCEVARTMLGRESIIGLSVENLSQIPQANSLDVDYIGVSPVFATPTKRDTAEPFGLAGLSRAVKISEHPVVAIGGVNIKTAPGILACGVDGLAVVSAIMGADNPQAASHELRELWVNSNL